MQKTGVVPTASDLPKTGGRAFSGVLAKLAKPVIIGLTYVTLAQSIAAYQPLLSQTPETPDKRGQSVVFDPKDFYLDKYISFESKSGKYSPEQLKVAEQGSLLQTMAALDSLKRRGFRKMPQNDQEMFDLFQQMRLYANRTFLGKFPFPDGVEFEADAFVSTPDSSALDCDTKSPFFAQLLKFYGIDSVYLVEVPYPGSRYNHVLLEIHTPWGSQLYLESFDPSEQYDGYDAKWMEKRYPCILGRFKAEPGNVLLRTLVASHLYNSGQVDTAKAELEALINEGYQYAPVFNRLAKIHLDKQDYRTALDFANASISISPNYAYSYCLRAGIHNLLLQPQAAMDDWALALKIDPHYFPALRQQAAFLSQNRRYGQALADYQNLIQLLESYYQEELEPGDYSGLAGCYWELGGYEDAGIYYKKARELA
ncbi:MAG: hypothetical protein V1728_03695 [Candidatus Micrarchaeota archaeon]